MIVFDPRPRVCVFDAYGTLFDIASPVRTLTGRIGEDADALATIWRQKQLEYAWLRTLMGVPYRDFWGLTQDALDFAMDATGISGDELRRDLLALYQVLDSYPEVATVLGYLRDHGVKTAILTNGAPEMVSKAVDHAGLRPLLDEILTVDPIGAYKPTPAVYQTVSDRFGLADTAHVGFFSSNAWDVAGAAHFGFRVIWVNRFGMPKERLPGAPLGEVTTLDQVALVGA
jgi:2-haloacid dehalogenase